MKRRDFGKAIAAGAAFAATRGSGAAIAGAAQTQPKKTALMHVGGGGSTTKEGLEYLMRHGVYSVDGPDPKEIPGKGWDLEDALKTKEICEKAGVKIETYHLPKNLTNTNVLLGKSPERDRDIEMMQQMISVAGKVGIRACLYNTQYGGNLRTGRSAPDPKRGNVTYSMWDYQEALKKNEGLTEAGVVTKEMTYERIKYMLDRLMPVAEEYKVQLGNHIADPPTHEGYRGITRWNSPDVFEGIKRFANLYKSPYHGFNLCLGSAAEGLKDPKTEILPIIKWMGERKQIFNIHFRNIKGGWDHFMEVAVDDGDMDMCLVMRALRDVEYPYMVQPDHTLGSDDPAAGRQYTAFCYGYIKALIQAVNGEVA